AAVVWLALRLEEALRTVGGGGELDGPDGFIGFSGNRETLRRFDAQDGGILLPHHTRAIAGGELRLVKLQIRAGAEDSPDDIAPRKHRSRRRRSERDSQLEPARDRRSPYRDDAVRRR